MQSPYSLGLHPVVLHNRLQLKDLMTLKRESYH